MPKSLLDNEVPKTTKRFVFENGNKASKYFQIFRQRQDFIV